MKNVLLEKSVNPNTDNPSDCSNCSRGDWRNLLYDITAVAFSVSYAYAYTNTYTHTDSDTDPNSDAHPHTNSYT
jgi:hypothetical protein